MEQLAGGAPSKSSLENLHARCTRKVLRHVCSSYTVCVRGGVQCVDNVLFRTCAFVCKVHSFIRAGGLGLSISHIAQILVGPESATLFVNAMKRIRADVFRQ